MRDDLTGSKPDGVADLVREVKTQLEALIDGLKAYRPKTSEPDNPDDQKWVAGAPHHEMMAIADALEAQATLILREVTQDLRAFGLTA
ncbi:MAG: hypothetical protein AB3N21_06285 [Ruegeria sp.]|uniref:hypothetical protein n=1 Tax=Ruegeria sp. TaxID=1879320 RepID=UPI00349E5036